MGLGSAKELGHGYTNMSDSELRCHKAGQCHGCHIIEECDNRKPGLYYRSIWLSLRWLNICKSS